jgi:DNA-binding protein Fis
LTQPLVMQAISDAGGNKTMAAARLGVSRKTVHEYVKGTIPGDAQRGPAPL